MARHGLEKVAKGRELQAKKEKRNARRALNKLRENDTDHQLALTQKVFNRWIKLERFAEQGDDAQCISCRKPANLSNLGSFAAGHLKTVGAHNELRFNTLNVELQCNFYCNQRLSGNLNGNKHSRGYLAGLDEVYGPGTRSLRLNRLERPVIDHTRDVHQLKIVRQWCSGRIRQLERELGLET